MCCGKEVSSVTAIYQLNTRSEAATSLAVRSSSFCEVTLCSLVTVTDGSERRTAFTVKVGLSPTEVRDVTSYNKSQGYATTQGARIQDVNEKYSVHHTWQSCEAMHM